MEQAGQYAAIFPARKAEGQKLRRPEDHKLSSQLVSVDNKPLMKSYEPGPNALAKCSERCCVPGENANLKWLK